MNDPEHSDDGKQRATEPPAAAHQLSTRQVVLIFIIVLGGVVLGSILTMRIAERDDLRRGRPPGPMDHVPLSRPQTAEPESTHNPSSSPEMPAEGEGAESIP
ncbi:MAG TPA: hypothetical protein VMS21_10075 [Methylomirabilota bacterium]|nr:hypothetical protein [Methylomirabilota bacterium]